MPKNAIFKCFLTNFYFLFIILICFKIIFVANFIKFNLICQY